jgi:hypothetical protein
LRPEVPSEARRPERAAIGGVEKGAAIFVAVAKTVGQEEIDHFISPVARRGIKSGPARQSDGSDAIGPLSREDIFDKSHIEWEECITISLFRQRPGIGQAL